MYTISASQDPASWFAGEEVPDASGVPLAMTGPAGHLLSSAQPCKSRCSGCSLLKVTPGNAHCQWALSCSWRCCWWVTHRMLLSALCALCLLEHDQTRGRKGMGQLCVWADGEERKTVKRNHSWLWASTTGHGILRNHSVKCTRSSQSLAGNESLVNAPLTWIYRFNIFLLHCCCCCVDCFINFLSCPEVC